MNRTYTARQSPWRARIAIIVVVFALGVLLAFIARTMGLWGGSLPGGADSNAVTITYSTEPGSGSGWGVVNSPMKVTVTIPWSTGSQDTVLSDVTLQLLDEANQPAIF